MQSKLIVKATKRDIVLGSEHVTAGPHLGVERVGVSLAESSYFATFADST